MDKRKKRTSINQYLMYIELLEKDPIFRSGIAPRDAEPNYLNNKWKYLSARLNTCPNGPQLSPEEWKKRLNDWKNSTRCKYRRSISGEKDIAMSPLEVKALSLFGKTPVLVRSSQTIEFKSEAKELYEAEKLHQAAAKSRIVHNQSDNNQSLDEDLEGIFIDEEEYNEDASVEEVEIKERKFDITNEDTPKSKRRRTIETTVYEIKSFSPKSVLSASTPQALTIASVESTPNVPPAVTPDEPPPIVEAEPPIEAQPAPAEKPPQINFDTSALELQLKRIADIKAAKLRFEIAKYKFNNPGFEYSTDVL